MLSPIYLLSLSLTLALPTILASPLPPDCPPEPAHAAAPKDDIAAMTAALRSIAPTSDACNPFLPGTCRTPQQAAGPILASFARYNLTTPQEKAAVVALMAYESDEFKYDVWTDKKGRKNNKGKGEEGRGTRNMQSARHNKQYATYLRTQELSGPEQVEGMSAGEVLGWLNSKDEYSFGSAAWYLATQCDYRIRDTLKASGSDRLGFLLYLNWCVFVDEDEMHRSADGRLEYYNAALERFQNMGI